MRLFHATFKNRNGQTQESSKWYVEFKDHTGKIRRIPACNDKRITLKFGQNLERLVEYRISDQPLGDDLEKWIASLPERMNNKLLELGLVVVKERKRQLTLAKHIDDYKHNLNAKGNTEHHTKATISLIRGSFKSCDFNLYTDITGNKVLRYLSEQRESGKFGARRYNEHIKVIKAFCNWMVKERRVKESPVAHLSQVNEKVDIRHPRRALDMDELKNLFKVTESQSTLHGMNGHERVMLYRLAVETGLRWGELRSLTRESFNFDGNPTTVTIQAKDSKHRSQDVLPLRPEMVQELTSYMAFKQQSERVFPMWRDKGGSMLKSDLEAAGIPYVDESGQYADFHSLRHCFITNLAKSGVHPKLAQSLARHSTITLTLDRYTHSNLETQAAALSLLPSFTADDSVLASCLASGKQKPSVTEEIIEFDREIISECETLINNDLTNHKNGVDTVPRTLNKGLRRPMLYPLSYGRAVTQGQ